MPLSDQRPKWLRNAGAIGLGTTLAVGMAVCTMGGYWLGQRFDQLRLGVLLGALLGLLFCGYEVWKVVRQSERESSDPSDGGN